VRAGSGSFCKKNRKLSLFLMEVFLLLFSKKKCFFAHLRRKKGGGLLPRPSFVED
jgi:hypothetical protein